MNRNTAIVLAFVVIGALVVGATYILPLLEDELPLSTSVEFYDENGDLVGSSVSMAIYGGGAEVYSMTVKAAWTVDMSAGVDPATFNANIKIEVELEDEYTGLYEPFDTKQLDSPYSLSENDPVAVENWQDGNWYVPVHTWVLADVLPMEQDWKDHGWNLKIKSTLTPTAKSYENVDVVPDPSSETTPTIDVALTWIPTTESMTIISFGIKKWLDVP